jgi:UDP-N-acetylmuramoyl-L-alanyl-D-glutamate--2,6-diaminopimelate ligase
MDLTQLLSLIPKNQIPASSSLVSVPVATEVLGLTANTAEILPGWVFFAIPGSKRDGHDYISDAISKGACALVVENLGKIPRNVTIPIQVVKRSRETLLTLSAEFFGNPSREMFCVGVTGTNGKTSITYMLEWVFNSVQVATGVLGTINHHLREKVWPTALTTPDCVSLQSRLRQMRVSS